MEEGGTPDDLPLAKELLQLMDAEKESFSLSG